MQASAKHMPLLYYCSMRSRGCQWNWFRYFCSIFTQNYQLIFLGIFGKRHIFSVWYINKTIKRCNSWHFRSCWDIIIVYYRILWYSSFAQDPWLCPRYWYQIYFVFGIHNSNIYIKWLLSIICSRFYFVLFALNETLPLFSS